MITYSIIKKNELEGARRLDAEYYQPEYLSVGDNLRSSPLLFDVSKKITDFGAYSQMNFVNFVQKGVRFLRNQDIGEFLINDSDPIYISKEVYEKLSLKLKKFDIVTPRVGTLGNAAVIFDENLPSTANQNLAQIVPDLNKINPIYLAIFLCSKYGRKQFERAATGNVQPWLNLSQIKNLKVFVPSGSSQSIIEKLARDSSNKQKMANKFYYQAEELLLKELGLKNAVFEDELSYVVNFSDAKNADRIDAEYFHPKYVEILQKLKHHKVETLTENFEILRGKNFSYSEDGEIGVIKTKQLGRQFIDFGVEDKTKKETVKKENLPIIENFDVIFASMGVGSLGKTNIFYDFENETGEFTIDSTLRIFRKRENGNLLSEVLSVYLSSRIGQELIYKYVVGSSGIISIYENYLESFQLPILEKTVQKKIADLFKKSHEARKKSKELLEEAKRKVEEMIEKGNIS